MIPNFKKSPTSGIYLDNAASTRMHDEVFEVMRPYYLNQYGNPSSAHSFGKQSLNAMEDARGVIAHYLGCKAKEIYFTSGGTESNNWAVNSRKYDVIVSSTVEHPSVTNAIKATGAKYEEISVDHFGMVDLLVLEDALARNRNKSILVSIQHANSETGTIQRVAQIAEIAHKYNAVFHMDAVQSFCKFDWKVIDVKADLISISARKIHGPFGIGALYVNSETIVNPFIYGGGQENGMRSGTPDVPSIVGFAKAVELTFDAYQSRGKDIAYYCKHLWELMNGYYENVSRNGNVDSMLPNIVNLTVPDIDANLVVALLDAEYNVMCSTGSACSTGKGPSKTLSAMGVNTKSSFRISMSPFNTEDDMLAAYDFIGKAMEKADKLANV